MERHYVKKCNRKLKFEKFVHFTGEYFLKVTLDDTLQTFFLSGDEDLIQRPKT